MKMPINEVQIMQNPALGAALIWRFACGYCPDSDLRQGVPLPLAFLVLPLTLHERTREQVSGTQRGSGLRVFEAKFSDDKDRLLAIHDRSLILRKLSLHSLRIAFSSGLMTLVPNKAELWPRSRAAPPAIVYAPVRTLLDAAEKIGHWAGQLTLFELAGIFKVDF